MLTTGFERLMLAAIFCLSCALALPAWAEENWRAEFDAACAKTDIAMSLSESELLALTETCDRLQNVIEGLEETERKVFLRRLQMCKNLYLFVLETKRQEQPPR